MALFHFANVIADQIDALDVSLWGYTIEAENEAEAWVKLFLDHAFDDDEDETSEEYAKSIEISHKGRTRVRWNQDHDKVTIWSLIPSYSGPHHLAYECNG